METVLYGDLFIAGNSLVNITIFIFVGKFLRKHINLCKYSIVSIGMSMLYLLAVYKNFVLSSIVSQLLIIIAGILLFKPKSIWETVILYLIIGLFSFLSVTIINVLIYYTGIKNGKIVIPIGILVSNAIINFSAKNLYKTKNYYDVEILNNNKSILIKAFMDTGHSLIDPISKKPVLIVEYRAFNEMLPLQFRKIFEKENIYSTINEMSENSYVNKLRIIPYSSLGNEKGILIGFEVDKMIVNGKSVEKPIVGIYNSVLCKNGLYNALISPKHLGRQ